MGLPTPLPSLGRFCDTRISSCLWAGILRWRMGVKAKTKPYDYSKSQTYACATCVLLSWAFEASLNCSVMRKPPRWFDCYFRRSCWIHCWLLLAFLSDYFGHLVSSTSLLCKFWGLRLMVFLLWGVERVLNWRDRLSQVTQLPWNGLRKHAETEADVKRVTPNPAFVPFLKTITGADQESILTDFLLLGRSGGMVPQEMFFILTPQSPLPWVSESFR